MDSPAEESLVKDAARRSGDDILSIRPASFAHFVGQGEVVANLKVMIEAAKLRGEPIEHLLFSGPPGLGKTTLAHLIANEMDSTLISSSGPLLERPGDLVAILSSLQTGQVFFIDEIHRLPRGVEETLYSAMEDFRVDIVTGTGPGARTITLPLEHYTLLGASTRTGLLSAPLRDRFGVIFQMEFYEPEELGEIIARAAKAMSIGIEDEAQLHLARHSRGTPRVALRLLRRMRDFAQVAGTTNITLVRCQDGLKHLGISELGLDRMDREIVLSIIDRFSGGPVGLDTLAAVFHEERDVLTEVHEPYLLKIGFLKRTPRGRMATPRAYEYFKRPPPADDDAPLFEE